MKGEITARVLENLENTVLDLGDLFAAFLTAGYGASMRKLDFEASKRRRARLRQSASRREVQRYYTLLHKLKKEGVLAEQRKNGSRLFFLTRRGAEKLKKLRERLRWGSVLSPKKYKKEIAPGVVVVAFDIPESKKRKREWLREVLRGLGMRLIQKSVWVGRCRIPKELLDDLKELNLLHNVEIFEVTKAGSL